MAKGKAIAIGAAALLVIGGLSSPSESEEPTPSPSESEIVVQVPVKTPEPSDVVIEEPSPAPSPVTTQEPVETSKPAEKPIVSETPAPVETPVQTIDPEQAFRESLMQYNYVGSSESDKYHYPTCRWTNAINNTNLVHFDTEEEATSYGYSPCGSCKP